MMLLKKELSDPNSCLNRAHPDEMVFVLLARDVAAPNTIKSWVTRRLAMGKNNPDDAQILEALACAHEMERQQIVMSEKPLPIVDDRDTNWGF